MQIYESKSDKSFIKTFSIIFILGLAIMFFISKIPTKQANDDASKSSSASKLSDANISINEKKIAPPATENTTNPEVAGATSPVQTPPVVAATEPTKMPVSEKVAATAPPLNPVTSTPSPTAPPVKPVEKVVTGYIATLKTTAGNIEIQLNRDQTPKTVKNFVDLSRKDFYNNTIFHRVIKGFMIQGGDPKGTGTGGPGYKFDDEPFTGEYSRGTVAMANSGPNTNGSQFFIMHQTNDLPKHYVIFGHVTKGLDVVDAIANSAVGPSSTGELSKPVTPVKVLSVDIQEQY